MGNQQSQNNFGSYQERRQSFKEFMNNEPLPNTLASQIPQPQTEKRSSVSSVGSVGSNRGSFDGRSPPIQNLGHLTQNYKMN